MRTLFVDIETFSSVSLPDCGVYKYAESPDFDILLLGYAFDDDPVRPLRGFVQQNHLKAHHPYLGSPETWR